MTNKNSWIKILGVVTTIAGVAVSLLSDYVNEQKMNERIEEKIGEALAERDEETEES